MKSGNSIGAKLSPKWTTLNLCLSSIANMQKKCSKPLNGSKIWISKDSQKEKNSYKKTTKN